MSTLICIDLQKEFIDREINLDYSTPGYDQVLDNVKNLILDAKKNNDFIVFVEYSSTSRKRQRFGLFPSKDPTLQEILSLVSGYQNKFFVYKNDMDGGEEVVDALNHYLIPLGILNICGVYTDACVMTTVETISSLLPKSKIKIIKKATCTDGANDFAKEHALHRLQNLSNVFIK
jgi:nicotinamidase-related amidase